MSHNKAKEQIDVGKGMGQWNRDGEGFHILNMREIFTQRKLVKSPIQDKATFVYTDCQQVEHCSDRPDDVFPWVRGEHSGAAGPAGEVWEQDPDPYQDRPQL